VLTVEVLGLDVPDAGAVFLVALGVHVLAGATCVVAGAVAAFASKRRGWHPRAGVVYLYGIGVVFATASVMSVIRWEHNWHLFLIATVAFGSALIGWQVRHRRPARWLLWHGLAMAGSYVALLTGFYVDNGSQLPGWDRLPTAAYWLLPAVVGVPLTWWALHRNGAFRWRRRVGPRSGAQPCRSGRAAGS
jgi:hypothetical protein